jgi:isopentenyl diphosphate isomerase/L-lactate dehydrogenase-like FMN-dependent dehydrogenase
MRRLIDVSQVDLSTEIMGTQWKTPIVIAPVASQKAFHPDGEVAVARAAQAKGNLMILSTVANTSVEEATQEAGGPIWYQLYPTNDWNITSAMLKRAEDAGCPAVVFTVDLQGGSNRETLRRLRKVDYSPCGKCHDQDDDFAYYRRKPMFDDLDLSNLERHIPSSLTWEFVHRLKDTTSMKVLIKGIVTREDAALSVEHGADGIIVSNHGGRAEESGRSTIECLPEVIEAVDGQIPVLIDSGFRRGTDIFKALALGAQAVCIGRPYLWGLGAFGQAGVEAVLEILRKELEMVMKQAGAISIDQITRAQVTDRSS